MFILIVNIIADSKTVEPYAEQHRNWVKKCLAERLFIAAGARKGHSGGVILAKDVDREYLLEKLKEDIYLEKNIAKYDVIEIDCKYSAVGYENLLDE